MKYKLALYAAGLAAISMTGAGCKKYLDINQNPNVAQDAPVEFLLPSAEINIASALEVGMNINGSFWAQHWTQSPASSQYKIFEQYSPNASTYDRPWSMLYSSALADLDRIEKKATAESKTNYIAVAKLLKAYSFQLITDAWGDVPYSQALKGLPEDGGITAPKFDAQADIYEGIITMVKDAKDIIANGGNSALTGDLVYAGSMAKWLKFANSLELKMYLRLSEVNPARAQAGIATLPLTSASYIVEADNAQISYIATSGNQNPLYSEMVGLNRTQNIVASRTSVDSFVANGDLRAYGGFYVKPSNPPVGIPQGAYNLPSSTVVSAASPLVGGDANDANSALAPVKLFTSYESLLLQAEAVARGWGAGAAGTDSTLFARAVTANFAIYAATVPATVLRDSFPGVPKSAATTFTLTPAYALYRYLRGDTLTGFLGGAALNRVNSTWGRFPKTGTVIERVRHIITQKWFCMNGNQGFEAWTEWRRTGYPNWFVQSANSIIGPGKFPARFFYPDVEVQRNINFPGQKLITDRVYWDIN